MKKPYLQLAEDRTLQCDYENRTRDFLVTEQVQLRNCLFSPGQEDLNLRLLSSWKSCTPYLAKTQHNCPTSVSPNAKYCHKSVTPNFPSPQKTAFFVGATGFEPATSWSQTKRSSRAELRPEYLPNIYFLTKLSYAP
jgi:hypothetical protein